MISEHSNLDAIMNRLMDGGDFTFEDYEAVTSYYFDAIPYDTLKSRDGTVEEWFLNNH